MEQTLLWWRTNTLFSLWWRTNTLFFVALTHSHSLPHHVFSCCHLCRPGARCFTALRAGGDAR